MMNNKLYICIVLALVVLSGCSKDEEEEEFRTFSPSAINFINKEGALISGNDCVDPNNEYLIEIKVNAVGSGTSQPTRVEYTINGALYSMTFADDQSKTNPIILVEGENIAQLVESGFSSSVFRINQGDFELVE